MYFLFRFHNMDPARVERMPIREKQVLFRSQHTKSQNGTQKSNL